MSSTERTKAAKSAALLVMLTPILILAFANVCSFADRQLTSILAHPISETLDLSHTQMALLGGTAFAILYGVAGIPAGLAADRYTRRYLIFGAIALWSLCTAACGFASSFAMLFAARMGVGLGEAVLLPCAFSLIRDLVPTERRGLAFAVFGLGMPIGSALSLAIGGVLNAELAANPLFLSSLGDLHAWQKTFILVSLLGVPAGLLVLLLPEPPRSAHRQTVVAEAPVGRAIAVVFLVAVALVAVTFMGLGFWVPSTFMERFGLSTSEVGLRLAVISIFAATIGMFSMGAISDSLSARFGLGGAASIMAGCILLMVPAAILISLDQPWNWMGVAIYFFAAIGFTPVASSIALRIGRAAQAGLIGAIYAFVVNIFGTGLGPLFYGAVNDHSGLSMTEVLVVTTLVLAAAAAVASSAIALIGSARARRTRPVIPS